MIMTLGDVHEILLRFLYASQIHIVHVNIIVRIVTCNQTSPRLREMMASSLLMKMFLMFKQHLIYFQSTDLSNANNIRIVNNYNYT